MPTETRKIPRTLLENSFVTDVEQSKSIVLGQTFLGNWNALTNSPLLTSTPSTKRDYYVVSVAGRQSITGTSTNFFSGDLLVSNGTSWVREDKNNGVISNLNYTDNPIANSMIKELYLDFGTSSSSLADIKELRVIKNLPISGSNIWSISLKKEDLSDLVLFFFSTVDKTGTDFFTVTQNGITAYLVFNWENVVSSYFPLSVNLFNKCKSLNYNPIIKNYIQNLPKDVEIVNLDFFDSEVLQQNYFDDLISGSNFQMLRTDKIVLNQGNLGLTATNKAIYDGDLRYQGDDKSLIAHEYLSWLMVQEVDNVYKFDDVITPILQTNADLGKRTIFRIFPTAVAGSTYNNYTHISSTTGTSKTCRINYPTYVANLMDSGSGQFIENVYSSNEYWLLDVNLETVYQEYKQLLQAFSTWLYAKNLTIGGVTKAAKDLILYFEFGFIGAWGEGNWHNLPFTQSVSNMTRYYTDIMGLLPDFVIASGIDSWGSDGSKAEQLFFSSKNVSNSVGYLGTFIDHLGAKDQKVFSGKQSIADIINTYVDRGDFFTGEFAMFVNDSNYWKGNAGMWTYSLFTKLKMPYTRIHNISITNTGTYAHLDTISKQTFYHINNSLSIVGFRYVLSIIYSRFSSNILTLHYELNNIGLNKCYFDIYRIYIRVINNDTSTTTDTLVSYDLRNLIPKNSKFGQFALGNGEIFTFTQDFTGVSSFSVSLIIKDKDNLQNPLYLSNYNRQGDGSYLLYSI